MTGRGGRHALLLLDGDRPTRAGLDAAWPGWDADVDDVVAADGGARLAAALGMRIDRWVGDGDSLGPEGLAELRRAGIPTDLAPTSKDETDAELGLVAAIAAGATRVTILGAIGGPRLDHGLANALLLGHPAAADVEVELLDDRARVRLLAGPSASGGGAVSIDLGGRIGDLVSLIALVDTDGVTTRGLHYPLEEATLATGAARGVSNVREAADATVTIRHGRLLVVEVPATLRA